MKTAIVVLLSFAGIACAQESKLAPQSSQRQVKKLGSVTWNVETHKLEWTIQKGSTVNGQFVPTSEDRYEITPDDAVMSFSNEKRGFTQTEATNLQHLLDVLSLYCAESVVWWDQGEGVPLTPGSKAVPERKPDKSVKPGSKPTKVNHQPDKAPAPYHVSEGDLIAALEAAR